MTTPGFVARRVLQPNVFALDQFDDAERKKIRWLNYSSKIRAIGIALNIMRSEITLEGAAYLRVRKSLVYRLLKAHSIPAFKTGSDWRFNQKSMINGPLTGEP